MHCKRFFSTLLAAAILLAGLSACGSLTGEDAVKAAGEMNAAALKAMSEEMYYYKETHYAVRDSSGNVVTPAYYTELNLWAQTDVDGNHLYDETNGVKVLRDYKIKMYRKVNNRSDIQFISGISKNGTDTTFFWQWDENDKATFVRYAATREQFTSSALFEPFSLNAKVTELADLRPEEMNFTGSKAKIKRSGKLVALSFNIKPEYFARIQNGKDSVLYNSTHVEVEFSYGRISRLSVYKPSISWMKEEEKYTIEIVYVGPKFDVPDYSSGDWSEIGVTSELPLAV